VHREENFTVGAFGLKKNPFFFYAPHILVPSSLPLPVLVHFAEPPLSNQQPLQVAKVHYCCDLPLVAAGGVALVVLRACESPS
jgi:hypothetical protein